MTSDQTLAQFLRGYNPEKTVMDEATLTKQVMKHAAVWGEGPLADTIDHHAVKMVSYIRDHPRSRTMLEDFMQGYGLTTAEGIAVMRLAEALLRVPDAATGKALIRDVLAQVEREKSRGHTSKKPSKTSSKKAASKVAQAGFDVARLMLGQENVLGQLVARLGLPMARQATKKAIHILGGNFVFAPTMPEAVTRIQKAALKGEGYLYSFDMLGEGARDQKTADRYHHSYAQAIESLAQAQHSLGQETPLFARSGISIKLSALHPRFEARKAMTCVPELIDRVTQLALMAHKAGMSLTIDAEEADRLELTLAVLAGVKAEEPLRSWAGLGLAVQAYQKRCLDVLVFVRDLAKETQSMIPIRLVKGAYWDSEIKWAQEQGLRDYPVFTLKQATDVNYIEAARFMLRHADVIYPQFAGHNVWSMAAIIQMAPDSLPKETATTKDLGHAPFELQCLYGMGQSSLEALMDAYGSRDFSPVRIYAPVGAYDDLLPYLVRRLLENGANSSFVTHVHNADVPAEALVVSPYRALQIRQETGQDLTHESVPKPCDYLGNDREAAGGETLWSKAFLSRWRREINDRWSGHEWVAQSLLDAPHTSISPSMTLAPVYNPAWPEEPVGEVMTATEEQARAALEQAEAAQASWGATPVSLRAACLRDWAERLNEHRDGLRVLLVREAGKILEDAESEIREAIDFLRFYADEAEKLMGQPTRLPSPTGEQNTHLYEPKGVTVCISPWNFPLAIFTGQVAAALVTGNPVIAKPAEQTPLVAYRCVQMAYDAGIPREALAFLPGRGSRLGPILLGDSRVAAVAFTGGTNTAHILQKTLLDRGAKAPMAKLVAETGGQNAMIIDSTALLEQVVDDVLLSGFYSAGQRCSALRVLYLQEDIADAALELLSGAMDLLVMGDPADPSTDIGPVIDIEAAKRLQDHINEMQKQGQLLHQTPKPDTLGQGFIPPSLIAINHIKDMDGEHFGPIVHVRRFKTSEIEAVIAEINSIGYGLTAGIHSRLNSWAQMVAHKLAVGNVYINRGMTGAVVGVHPFGGHGLSGTGPKAGGPDTLKSFVTEKTITINTTAAGGNVDLARL